MVEGAKVFDAECRQHPRVEPPEGDAQVLVAIGAEGALALRPLHSQGGHGDPPQAGEDQPGHHQEDDRTADRADEATDHGSSPRTTRAGPAMYPCARTVTIAS